MDFNAWVLETDQKYNVANEEEALKLRDYLNDLENGKLTNFSYTVKYIKEKGEIVDSYVVVKAKLKFNDEKDPSLPITIEYNCEE